jgi:LAO/AO transport system kinase|tara:strand:- start:212 stop:1219 length:1008 start_codon:yes stop_codon:yes gene_type:complete
MSKQDFAVDKIARKIELGDRRALSRAITLVESSHPTHREQAAELLQALRTDRQAIRIGMSGTPGVGKSTFIESFGLQLVESGLRVAVLAVDPSSAISGGSILGDKTRMDHLSRHPSAFIRPSPSQTHLGGVARRTREATALCEAAGFDVVLIETVGVGQSETMVAEMADLFVLLLAPAGGDELQGVKRGIMEMADLILVNKADGDLKATATRTCADYAGALRLLRKRGQDPEDFPKALMVSAIEGNGLRQSWVEMQALVAWRKQNEVWQKIRADQNAFWFNTELRHALLTRLENDPEAAAASSAMQKAIRAGEVAPSVAAERVVQSFLRTKKNVV